VDFYANYEEIELQKISFDAILLASSSLRHQNNVTKFFFHFDAQNSSLNNDPAR